MDLFLIIQNLLKDEVNDWLSRNFSNWRKKSSRINNQERIIKIDMSNNGAKGRNLFRQVKFGKIMDGKL